MEVIWMVEFMLIILQFRAPDLGINELFVLYLIGNAIFFENSEPFFLYSPRIPLNFRVIIHITNFLYPKIPFFFQIEEIVNFLFAKPDQESLTGRGILETYSFLYVIFLICLSMYIFFGLKKPFRKERL